MLHAIITATALALTGPQVGAPAPDFHLTTLEGKPVALGDFRGKTLVLNEWATWCPPCRQETPDLIALAKKQGAKGDVVFLGVDSTEAAPIVRAFVASKGMPYTTAIDAQKTFSKAYDVRAYPTTYVISPDGVLRARYVGNVTPQILTAFIDDARAGRNGVLATEAQKKADALLDPAKFALSGDVVAVRAAVKTMLKAIDAADAIDGDTDYIRIQAQENALRDAAVKALEPLAATPADTALLARLQGDAAYAREEWPVAIAAYQRGRAIAPDDEDLLGGYASTLHATGDDARATDTYTHLAKLDPSVDALVSLGVSAGDAKRFNDAGVAFSRAIGTARAAVKAKPGDAKAIRKLAWAYLYQGRMYVKAAEPEKARASFAQTSAWTAKLPKTDSRYDMYLEEAQEATVALDAVHPQGKTALSLAPWTGPDLPGSVSSTYKYRLVVAGTPGKNVALAASGLPKHWVASFCSDRQCAPFRTMVALPASGVKVIEFQVIPQSASASAPTVRIDGDGASTSVKVASR
ncbi:MAG: alkyl hydroperoxide reductase/Thiol specific antioxidant/Mal allergen [Candidatus Eremiobacteraeota bacterium]|nr:alkyl hydroperoxide reductase/Thiol specific antioxidant/Mal allergen [Candidatus Eremiobacteraeota bacterium]